jgi:hypothetical protein
VCVHDSRARCIPYIPCSPGDELTLEQQTIQTSNGHLNRLPDRQERRLLRFFAKLVVEGGLPQPAIYSNSFQVENKETQWNVADELSGGQGETRGDDISL